MTGPRALSRELRKKGYELGADEANAAGGVSGLPVKIVYEDDEGTNPGAVAAVRRLLAQQPVVAVSAERSTMVDAIHLRDRISQESAALWVVCPVSP